MESLDELKNSGQPLLRPRKSLAEEAAEALRELILLEKLKPGIPIPERDLASVLGISRTPLREALKILEHEGLIEYSSTRRPFVANPSLLELADLIKVIGALESLAGELACERANQDEIKSISSLAEEMSKKSDRIEPLDFFKIDMEFHRQLVASSRNPALIETHRQYNARLWRARFVSSRRVARRTMTLDQHDQIADSLKKRDTRQISIALRNHLDTTINNISEDQEENLSTPHENHPL
jgi:DNA-binding GntR family transcriptional regulator